MAAALVEHAGRRVPRGRVVVVVLHLQQGEGRPRSASGQLPEGAEWWRGRFRKHTDDSAKTPALHIQQHILLTRQLPS